MANDKKMRRGVQQALYKYLPGSWVDYIQSGGGVTYAVHVDTWNSIQLPNINNKRLLRIVNQRVHEFIAHSSEGEAAVVDFASNIDEETYEVLTPKVSDTIGAIHTSVKPWVFACSSCGRVRQYYSYDEFKRREHQPCENCGKHMTQIRMIRFCRCGYADGIYVPKCQNPDHGTKYMYRRGSGTDFVCSKCGKKAVMSHVCPDCHNQLEIRPALDSSHFIPATVTLIDLLDKRKDIFLDKETDYQGEKVVISQYLGLVSPEQYEDVVAKGNITREDDFEKALQIEADSLRAAGLDDATIAMVIDAKRRSNPNNHIFEAIAQVSNGLSVGTPEEYTPIAEAILEYDELLHAKVTLSLEEAANDAELINDGVKPSYRELASRFGFSNVQVCSSVPIVSCSYGYTRNKDLDRSYLCGYFDLVIVDEAQDFTEDWAYCANLLVKDKGSLYVFFDESQNLFSRDFGDKFFIDSEPFVLRYNIRNTSNIYQYTLDRTALGTDTLVNQIEGVEPDVRKLTRKQAVISFVDSVVNKLVNKEGVSPKKIVILSNQRLDQSVLNDVSYVGGYPLTSLTDTVPGGVVFASVEDFKGLESDIIIFINHTYKGEANTKEIRAIQYTALTRARFYLYVIDYERTL